MAPSRQSRNTTLQTCDQCGLPYGRGGVVSIRDDVKLHFCCYGCSFTHSVLGQPGETGTAGLFLARLGFSAFLSMNVMALSWALYDQQWIAIGMEPEALPWIEKLIFVLSLPVLFIVGWPYLQAAAREFRSWRLSMDSLIALGSFAAFVFSTYQVFSGGHAIYFDTATMTLVLVTAGRYLEANAKIRTSAAIRKLIDLQPDRVRKLIGKDEQFVGSKDVQPGDHIKVLAGERIPLDGIVLEGTTSVDEATLTGESTPLTKRPGDSVYAATMNQEGVIVAQVTAPAAETVHAHIVRLMEEAQRSRSPIQQSVDRIAGIFIPVVMVLSVLTFIGWLPASNADTALLHALTVLVVACPCALGIGTPLASAIALGRAAEEGLLIRSSAIFEKLADSRHVVFDKTGTLTKGEPRLWELHTRLPEKEFLGIVASLERNSEHPLGRAVTARAKSDQVPAYDVRNVSVLPGLGIKGEVNIRGRWVMVQAGSAELFDVNPDNLKQSDERSATVMYAGWDGTVQGSIIFNDALRRYAKETIGELRDKGIETHILSGDSRTITRSIAEALSIEHVYGKLLPQDKLEIIHQLKLGGVTVMVGDGINDAPALSAADVGITLGSGTDIAKESADVTILGDHLEKIPWLIRYARRTLGVIRWNLLWAFGYNAVGIALAVSGLLQPILAAAAMVLSSVFIVVHSRRLASIVLNHISD